MLPRGAKPDPRGPRILTKTAGADGRTWELLAYRQRPKERRSGRGELPGTINYCLAAISNGKRGRGERRWRGVTCALSAAVALKLRSNGLYLQCSGGSYIVGEPVEPGLICGLVPADVESVTVTADSGESGVATLSTPFALKVNHQPHLLRRAGIDPDTVRDLPPSVPVRAVLFSRPPGDTSRADNATLLRDGRRARGRDAFPPTGYPSKSGSGMGIGTRRRGPAPGPLGWRLSQAGGVGSTARRGRRAAAARLRVDDQVAVGERVGLNRLLEQAVEEHPTLARVAAVEAEGELLQVGVEVRGAHPALVGAQEQRLSSEATRWAAGIETCAGSPEPESTVTSCSKP